MRARPNNIILIDHQTLLAEVHVACFCVHRDVVRAVQLTEGKPVARGGADDAREAPARPAAPPPAAQVPSVAPRPVQPRLASLEPEERTGNSKEDDLLDKAWGLELTSRLSCQARLKDEPVTIEIPKYTINQVSEAKH